MQKRLSGYDISIATAILLEIILLFNTKNLLGQTANSILYALCSISIGILLLLKYYNKHVELASGHSSEKMRQETYFSAVKIVVPILIIWLIYLHYDILSQMPIDPKKSDVIPMVQYMVQRFVHGEYVYKAIYDFGYFLSPTYMPLHWMPFTIAEICKFDYRWVAFCLWISASILLLVRTFKTNIHACIFVLLILSLFYYAIYRFDRNVIAYTLELTIAAYYILLIISINQTSAVYAGLGIALCVMSRYSLVLWLPLWFLVTILSREKKYTLTVIATVIVVVISVYVIPFLSKDWHIYSNTLNQYYRAAIGEWENLSIFTWKPYQLYAGTGFAHLFYESLQDWELADKIKRLQKVHFLVSIGITVVMGTWYWFNRKKIYPRIFLMASFKIYFTLFLAFIQVPYIYLMIVANFVSIAIFSEQMRYKITASKV